jgi:RimJ/RimL family protein N-acetyltransferase
MNTQIDTLFNPALELENSQVRLRLVRHEDLDELKGIALDPPIWTYFTTDIATEHDLAQFVRDAITDFEQGRRVTFVIINKALSAIAGMSSFGNISARDGRVEIGWSWLSTAAQGKGINRHCKYLMMGFAFEQLQFRRVEFKTDVLNQKARKALLKIGATEEGVLRSHTLMPHGRRRDTIYYSVLRDEWDRLKTNS